MPAFLQVLLVVRAQLLLTNPTDRLLRSIFILSLFFQIESISFPSGFLHSNTSSFSQAILDCVRSCSPFSSSKFPPLQTKRYCIVSTPLCVYLLADESDHLCFIFPIFLPYFPYLSADTTMFPQLLSHRPFVPVKLAYWLLFSIFHILLCYVSVVSVYLSALQVPLFQMKLSLYYCLYQASLSWTSRSTS